MSWIEFDQTLCTFKISSAYCTFPSLYSTMIYVHSVNAKPSIAFLHMQGCTVNYVTNNNTAVRHSNKATVYCTTHKLRRPRQCLPVFSFEVCEENTHSLVTALIHRPNVSFMHNAAKQINDISQVGLYVACLWVSIHSKSSETNNASFSRSPSPLFPTTLGSLVDVYTQLWGHGHLCRRKM